MGHVWAPYYIPIDYPCSTHTMPLSKFQYGSNVGMQQFAQWDSHHLPTWVPCSWLHGKVEAVEH